MSGGEKAWPKIRRKTAAYACAGKGDPKHSY